ncbi:hypothetical protein AHAS_Ahas10G0205600 [Arachis hypogaea]
MLSSWHGHDCCQWKGIGCDNVTGHVVMLDFASPYVKCWRSVPQIEYNVAEEFDDEFISSECEPFIRQYVEATNVNSSLLELEYLTHLDLSGNYFYQSPIPMFVGSMRRLSLNLSNNHLIGKIPNMIGDMRSLESFDVSTNQLSSTIPSSMSALTSLSHLNLSHNNFSGTIPTDNQFLTYDASSYAGNPYLCGSPLPNKCGYLHEDHGGSEFEDDDSNLDMLEKWLFYFVIAIGFATGFWGVIGTLWRSEAQIEYTSEEHDYEESLSSECDPFSDQYLKATNVNSSLLELEYLTHLDLSGNYFSWSPIPMFIGSMHRLSLNLSNNHLIGKIPNMIGDMRSLESFDVSSNQLSGTIPSSMLALTSLSHLNLSHNDFSGPIPTENQFSTYDSSSYAGNPYLCGSPLPNKCGYLHEDHGSNEFEDEDSNLDKLEKWLFYFVIAIGFATGFWGFKASLNDSSNMLFSWHGHDCCRWEGIGCDNDTGHVIMLDLASPYVKCLRSMSDNYDCGLLDHNQYLEAGNVNSSLLELEYLTHLDLTGIYFHQSHIPILNLSNNHLIGKIPYMIRDMTSLESFDVSSNQLSGTIPSSMLALILLSQLNLSYNNFSGPIPTDNQFLTFDSSSYAGNPYLCGSPLPNECGPHQVPGSNEFEDEDRPTKKKKDEDSKADRLEKWLFYFVIAIGFATGFW